MSKTVLPLNQTAFLAATWFGVGLIRPAPGTWGSLAALPFAWVIVALCGPIALMITTIVVFALGCWASNVYQQTGGSKDPSEVVIDEVVGQWLVLTAAPLEPVYYIIGFLLFRLCDIAKPWPASWADRKVSGGLGIMLDDVLAALYGLMAIALYRYWFC